MAQDKTPRITIEPFGWSDNDPLASQHAQVAALVSETLQRNGQWWSEVDLDTTAAGKAILQLDAKATVAIVLALVAHARYFDRLAKKARALASNDMERMNWHHSPEWGGIWPARQISAGALRRILRRKLPFETGHLVTLADWMTESELTIAFFYPIKPFIKAIESHGPVAETEKLLHDSLSRLVRVLRADNSRESAKFAQQIDELLLPNTLAQSAADDPILTKPAGADASTPAPVGSPAILSSLKWMLGIFPQDNAVNREVVGFDRFPLRVDSPLREEHELINMLLPEVVGRTGYNSPDLAKTAAGRSMEARNLQGKGRVLLAFVERCAETSFTRAPLEEHHVWQSHYAVNGIFKQLLDKDTQLNRDGLFELLLYLSALSNLQWVGKPGLIEKLVAPLKEAAAKSPLTPGERHVLYRLRSQMVHAAPFGRPGSEVTIINDLLCDGAFVALVPGEAWSDALNKELAAMNPVVREKWLALLRHAVSASGSRPSAKWLKEGREKLKAVGVVKFADALLRWFPLVNAPRTVLLLGNVYGGRSGQAGAIHEDNATCLRGLLWLAPGVASPDLIRSIGTLTVSAYRKIPGVGPRAVKVGNGGVYALSQINDPLAVGQLALLKIKVKFGSAQKEIEKAFTSAAERSGLPREELEEMSVPTYGLTGVGVAEEQLGEFTARLTITGTDSTSLTWIKAVGKTQRSVPAEVKASHAEDLKELQASAKDIQKMLPAQRERIDGLFLQQRVWPFAVWRERYLDHPLIGTLARRLLWEFDDGQRTRCGIWLDDRLVDIDLKPVDTGGSNATVRLWHPIGKNQDEIIGWRQWLEAQQIQQPFKQAHREIYLLTEAEQRTRTYSNRYAAHVIKQHQFNALCALRGWKNQLRLLVDAEYLPPSIRLPQWELRAEFWVEGIGHDYGADTNEAGVYLRLATDQVRFYRMNDAQRSAHAGGGGYHPNHRGLDAQPVPLEQISPLVFSEIMRDVDLFIGVASVGNDPAWADGGPQGRYRDYWQGYSFGELNASAKTRKDVLERLVPKLKIASVSTFEEKFLVVKGTLRTYKIHLGSGNILMEPNNQYLCIVPAQGAAEDSPVLLPFEGDRTLSVIISKAFLLADDTKIKDPSIVSQISRK